MKEGRSVPSWLIPPNSYSLSVCLCWHAATPRRSADFYFPNMDTSRSAYAALRVGNAAAFPPHPPPPNRRAARRDRLRWRNAPPSLTIPICSGRPWRRGGRDDGGMEGWIGRKRGRMMEWLLNIQHAAESGQRVVGSLHYGSISSSVSFQFVEQQHLFSLFSLFSVCSLLSGGVFWNLSY